MSGHTRRLTFWFEFASTYSYLSAMRIADVAAHAGVEVRWQPFLLGPIFAAQGWTSSPFNLYPAKGRYMVRDMERLAAARRLSFHMPDPFPQNGIAAARIALVALDDGFGPDFVRRVYQAEFADGAAIADTAVLAGLVTACGHDPARVLGLSRTDPIKERLRAATADAQSRGIFGAPMFETADGELFWGDDRLDHAVAWAQQL